MIDGIWCLSCPFTPSPLCYDGVIGSFVSILATATTRLLFSFIFLVFHRLQLYTSSGSLTTNSITITHLNHHFFLSHSIDMATYVTPLFLFHTLPLRMILCVVVVFGYTMSQVANLGSIGL